jgi:hypothetical protein
MLLLAVRPSRDHVEQKEADEVHAGDPSGHEPDAADRRVGKPVEGRAARGLRGPRRSTRRPASLGHADAAPGDGEHRAGPGRQDAFTDGPFAELEEAIGGYCFFDADDLDAAIELAAQIAAAGMGGAIEVRPIVEW